MQVLNQWAIVRELLFTYSRGPAIQRSEQGAWQYVLQQRPSVDIKDVLSLYVLSQVIVTQSADVERGFSLLNGCLGLNRLSTQIMTLDCRLRVKQALPSPFKNASEAVELSEHLRAVGMEPNDTGSPNASEIHRQLLLPNGTQPILFALHERLNIDKSGTWECMAEDFAMIDEVSVHVQGMPEQDVDQDDQDELIELERRLTVGQEHMSLEELTAALAAV